MVLYMNTPNKCPRKWFASSTNLDIVSLETIVSEIKRTDYVKMRAAKFKFVLSDILENADSLWNSDIANLEPTVNSAMMVLKIRSRNKTQR